MPDTDQRRLLTLPTVAVAAVAVAALSLTSGAAASATSQLRYPQSRPAWAAAANDDGAPPVDDLLEGELQFRLRDASGAERLAGAITSPGDPLYGHFVSPQAWIDRFSPSESDFDRGVAYLKSYGLQIIGVPKSRLFIVYRGTATQFNAAFDADMQEYREPGERLAAPANAPALPARLGTAVQAVDLAQVHHVSTAMTGEAAGSTGTEVASSSFPIPCSRYYGEHRVTLPRAYGRTVFPTAGCGYTGPQLRAAYGVGDLTGAGQKIGEIFWNPSPTIQQDVDRWSSRHGAPPLTTLRQIIPKHRYDVAACSGQSVEEPLDIEAMHGLAPRATIVFSAAADCDYGVDTALSTLLDDKLVSVVSNSYTYIGGEPTPDMVQAELHQQWQAAAEGIGLYYGSGDYGDNTVLGYPAGANYVATSPWVTAVGGTTTELAEDGSVEAQTGWGSDIDQVIRSNGSTAYSESPPGSFYSGAGGGVSTMFAEPSYQRGVVPTSTSHGMRSVPDVAADADPFSGLLTGYTPAGGDQGADVGHYVEIPIGGTSLATPIVATEAVLVQQQLGRPLGFVNPLIYRAARLGGRGFVDVMPELIAVGWSSTVDDDFLITADHDSSLLTTPGWDEVTGIGTISVAALSSAIQH